MSLRNKLLLAQAPLALALAFIGAAAVITIASLGTLSQAILQENYRSVLAAQRMKESIERLDSAAMFVLVGERDRGTKQVTAYRQRFETELRVEEGNITEPGETEAAQHLRQQWQRYQQNLDAFMQLTDPAAAKAFYFDELQPGFARAKDSADEILALNQDAMVQKSDRAQRSSSRMNAVMIVASLLALIVGSVLATILTNRLLRPLAILTDTVDRIGAGDFDARVLLTGGDELSRIGERVNAMADRLGQYRRSSLGELLLAQQAAQAAIDSLPDPVVVFDVTGNVLNCNAAAETLLNLRLEQGATNLLDTMPLAARAVIDLARNHVIGGKGAYVPKGSEEAIRIAASGGDRFFLVGATPVYGEQHGITGATVVLQDVTRLRRFDELTHDLVATVAHEFRTPLTSLRMAIHLCLEHVAGPLTDKQGDLLYAAREDCERLQGIVDELLDAAKIQAGELQLRRRPVPPETLVTTAVDAHRGLAEQHEVHLQATVWPGLDPVLADVERVQLVFANLLTNAIRVSPHGAPVEVRAQSTDGTVRFEVTDRGPGIAAEHQRRVFDKFFHVPNSTTSGGAGLGLSIAKEVVEAHGGTIGVDSSPGAGSTFWFTLPRAATAQQKGARGATG